jgi:hypothetical protein
MRTEEMNKGVQILLERIKSNPEEFTPDIAGRYPEKWRNVLQQVEARANGEVPKYLDFLSDAEIAELWRAMQDVRGDQFTKQVMNTLLRDGVELSSFSQGLGEGQKIGKRISLKASDLKMLQNLDVYEKQDLLRAVEEYQKVVSK